MINLDLLEPKNITIATIPRTASTFLMRRIMEYCDQKYGHIKAIRLGEFMLYEKNIAKESLKTYYSLDNISVSKIMIIDSYNNFMKKNNINPYELWSNTQTIILYPRKDYISHFTSYALPAHKSEIFLKQFKNLSDDEIKKINKYSGQEWWNVSNNDADTVRFLLRQMPKINNYQANLIMDTICEFIQNFKRNINVIKEASQFVLELSYDEIYGWEKNNKMSLIWPDPQEKLLMFEDPDYVVQMVHNKIENIGGWYSPPSE